MTVSEMREWLKTQKQDAKILVLKADNCMCCVQDIEFDPDVTSSYYERDNTLTLGDW